MYLLKTLAGRYISTGEKFTDIRMNFLTRLLNSLTGFKVYTPNIEKEKEQQLLEMLKELGLMKTFTKEYIPKEKKGFGR